MTEPKPKIKVLIADDHAVFRAGVVASLAHHADIEFIAQAENGMQLLNHLKSLEPDVILLDIQMPILDGIAALPEIKKVVPAVKIIMLTMNDEMGMISRLMEMGANSYLIKNSSSETIYDAIKAVHENEYYFNDYTNKAMLSGLKNKKVVDAPATHDADLTEKELHVLKLMCDEKSTKEIADIVEISPRTVEAIRDRLKLKTSTKTTAGLILYAVKHGIVEG